MASDDIEQHDADDTGGDNGAEQDGDDEVARARVGAHRLRHRHRVLKNTRNFQIKTQQNNSKSTPSTCSRSNTM